MSTIPTGTPRFHIYPNGHGTFNVCTTSATNPGRRGGCNPMPGATWGFKSIRDALLAIHCIMFIERRIGSNILELHDHLSGVVRFDAQRWWDLYHRVSGTTAEHRRNRDATAARMGRVNVRSYGKAGRHQYFMVSPHDLCTEWLETQRRRSGRYLGEETGEDLAGQ